MPSITANFQACFLPSHTPKFFIFKLYRIVSPFWFFFLSFLTPGVFDSTLVINTQGSFLISRPPTEYNSRHVISTPRVCNSSYILLLFFFFFTLASCFQKIYNTHAKTKARGWGNDYRVICFLIFAPSSRFKCVLYKKVICV